MSDANDSNPGTDDDQDTDSSSQENASNCDARRDPTLEERVSALLF